MSIRFGLQRFFQSSAKYDIINDPEFKLSNGAYGLSGQTTSSTSAAFSKASARERSPTKQYL